ncbi:MAG: hypothetical protein JHC20_07190 [Pyrobaculum sp.]|nr:hypothetical protein [Pyrobaculum sp.]
MGHPQKFIHGGWAEEVSLDFSDNSNPQTRLRGGGGLPPRYAVYRRLPVRLAEETLRKYKGM